MNSTIKIQLLIKPLLTIIIILPFCTGCGFTDTTLKEKIICIDPGHGGTANSDLFTRSVRSFPDSWLAGSAHSYRAKILIKLGKRTDAKIEEKRVSEYYVNLD